MNDHTTITTKPDDRKSLVFLKWLKYSFDTNLLTILASALVFFMILFMPQVRNLIFLFPTQFTSQDFVYSFLWVVFYALLAITYVGLARAVFPPKKYWSGFQYGNKSNKVWKQIVFWSLIILCVKWFLLPYLVRHTGLPKTICYVPLDLCLFFVAAIFAPSCYEPGDKLISWKSNKTRMVFGICLTGSLTAIIFFLINLYLFQAFMTIVSLFILAGILKGRIGAYIEKKNPTLSPFIMPALRLLFFWIFLFFAMGEFIWYLSKVTRFVSQDAYVVWAVIHLSFTIISIARLFDYYQSRLERYPVRLSALIVLVIFGLFSLQPVDIGTLSDTPPSDTEITSRWFDSFGTQLDRIEQNGGPAIFVASSGGGSRAALFASLVLQKLEEEKLLNSDRCIADNIALLSGVSGGSLANAYYLSHLDKTDEVADYQPCYSVRSEVESWYDEYQTTTRLKLVSGMFNNTSYAGEMDKIQKVLERTEEENIRLTDYAGLRLPEWIFNKPFPDRMGICSMAALMRGLLRPGSERGVETSTFWQGSFDWSRLRTHITDNSFADKASGIKPVSLFNTTEINRGTRMIIGYPPLPQDLLKRSGIRSLTDINSRLDLRLDECVRASANFPFGFSSPRVFELIEREGDTEEIDVYLTDGGVVDNTGLDSIVALLGSIKTWSRSRTENRSENEKIIANHSRKIWDQLKRTGIVLLIIDSGKKPQESSLISHLAPEIFFPLNGISNADCASADTNAENSIALIRNLFKDGSNDTEVEYLCCPIKFVCESPISEPVMTAWALSDKEKADIYFNFMIQQLSLYEPGTGLPDKIEYLRGVLDSIRFMDKIQTGSSIVAQLGEKAPILKEKAPLLKMGADRISQRVRDIDMGMVAEYDSNLKAGKEQLDTMLQRQEYIVRSLRSK